MNERDRFERAADLFAQASRLNGAERTSFLDRSCGNDEALRREVDELLAADADVPTFFDDDALERGAQARAHAAFDHGDASRAKLPKRIGSYEIESVIGAGGMGIVYRARQESPNRDVALKVIRAGAMSDQMLRRFRHEAQVLGRLDHPGIARIYEAGIDDDAGDSRPFLAMEYIDGLSLDQHAATAGLDDAGKLAIVARICDAVQHAHQKGIIHRDLKPANILIDRQGQPRVVDFGVARVTGADYATTTLATNPGQLVGTVQYMSPEQVEADPHDLDTRSDVYALGIILYQLLAGRLPHDLDGRSIWEMVRIVREEPAARLDSIDRRFRGDIDTIVMRAMEPDRLRRYQSAGDLATDIRLHLDQRPINARRDSTWYVFTKQVHRHRVAIVVGALILGIVATSVGFRVHDVIDDARKEAYMKTLELSDAIRDPFDASPTPDPALLERTAQWIDRERNDDPREAARLYRLIGLAYLKSGLPQPALAHLARALDLRRSTPGVPADELAQSLHDLGRPHYFLGAFETSLGFYEEALVIRRELLDDPAHSWKKELKYDYADSLNDEAACLKRLGRMSEAEAGYEEALRIRTELGDERWVAASVNNIATLLAEQQRWREAKAMFADALARIDRFGVTPMYLARTHRNIARCCLELGEFGDARDQARIALARTVEHRGDDAHPDVVRCKLLEARIAERIEDDDHVLTVCAELLALDLAPAAAVETHELIGRVLRRAGDRKGAEAAWLAALREPGVHDDHLARVRVRGLLVDLYEAWNRPEEADRYRTE